MENFGLHDRIEIFEREFHIHTGALVEHNRIVCEVFERGMFLIKRVFDVNLRKDRSGYDYDFLGKVTEDFHHSVITELESLFKIRSKLSNFKHPKSHYYLGILFFKRNLYEEAIEAFKKSLEQDQDFTEAIIGLGICYLKSRKFESARETFRTVYEQNERFAKLMILMGLSELFMENYDSAEKLLKDVIRMDSTNTEAHFHLGVALYKDTLKTAKDPAAVAVPARVSMYLKQLRDKPKYQHFQQQREFGSVLESLNENQHDIIIPSLENFQLQLVDVVPEHYKIYEFFLRFLFGGQELTLEDINNYERVFREVSEKHPSDPNYWNDLGTFSLIKSRGLYHKAISEFEKAIELSPNFENAKENLQLIRSNEKGFMILLRAILK